jgi:site-specific recombinase XerD
MQLQGLAERTQEAHVAAVRQLAEHYGKSPDQIGDEELWQYFLYLTNEKKASSSAITIAMCAIKFLYEQTLHQEWPTLALVRPPRERRLPVVLSREEVHRILGCLRRPYYRVCLSTIYSCGLGLHERVHLQVSDIDSPRMLIHARGSCTSPLGKSKRYSEAGYWAYPKALVGYTPTCQYSSVNVPLAYDQAAPEYMRQAVATLCNACSPAMLLKTILDS